MMYKKLKATELYNYLLKSNDLISIPEIVLSIICEYCLSIREKCVQKFGCYGYEDGEFVLPQEIAISEKEIYVVDSGNNRIQIFSDKGQFLSKFGSKGTEPGLFRCPSGIAVDGEGKIIVSENYGSRIQIFSKYGDFIAFVGSENLFREPAFIAVDHNGRIIVADATYNIIQFCS